MKFSITIETLNDMLLNIFSEALLDALKVFIEEGHEIEIVGYDGRIIRSIKTNDEFDDFKNQVLGL